MDNIDISHWEERTLTAAQVAKILSISVSSVYRKTGLGEIPKPKLVCGLTRWSGEALAEAIGKKKPINA